MKQWTIATILTPLLGLLLTTTILAQGWSGPGHTQGVVLDEDEKPIRGATVTLTPMAEGAEGPPPTRTDKKGRWTIRNIALGTWNLTITTEGYNTSRGWAQVQAGPGKAIRVVLRPLSEELPTFTEGFSQTVTAWIEKGNDLLEQGQAEAARREYEKVLRSVPDESKAEVLRSVARCYYLEKNPEAAAKSLQQALVLAPTDSPTRQLYTTLLAGRGKQAEAEAWLVRLDKEGAETLRAEVMPAANGANAAAQAAIQQLVDQPTEPPVAHRVGAYKTAFAERSPLSSVDVFLNRFAMSHEQLTAADPDGGAYNLAAETFQVFVPPSYAPGEPHGLIVWVSPTPFGGVSQQPTQETLAAKRLIWVGADHAGNARPRWDRIGLALDAAQAMMKLYDIDPTRVYAAGYSGGGRVSTALSMVYPEVFQGGFLFYGCDAYRDIPIPDKPGAHWPATYPEPPRDVLKQLRTEHRFVLLTGERDFNRVQCKEAARLFEKEGFKHVTYLEIPEATHYTGVDPEWLGKGIDALDAGR